MTKKFLHRANIVSVFQQMRREGMAERMTRAILSHTCLAQCGVASVANGLDEVAIYFWDVSTGKLVSKFAEHELINRLGQRLMISAISFSSNSRLLAVGLNWGVVRLLDLQNPSAPAVVNEHFVSFDTGISSVNFAADESLLVVATGKGVTGPRDFGVLKVLEIQSGREVSGFSKFGFVYDSSLSARGHLLAIAFNGGVTLIDTKSWATLRTLPSRAPKAVAFTGAARLLAVGGAYGGLQIWDVANAKLIRTLNLKSVSALAVSPDDGFVLVGSEDGRVRLYSLQRSD